MSRLSSATVLRLVDSVAVAISEAYRQARSRLASSASPLLRIMTQRDQMVLELELLRREIGILRDQRASLAPHRRPDFRPSQRFAILQLRRMRGWSVKETANHFVVHTNTLRTWIKAAEGSRFPRLLAGAVVWNRIDDVVRWTIHELRQLCPDPEFGSRAIARHVLRAGISISRSSVQRILREPKPFRPSHDGKVRMFEPIGEEPHHLLTPAKPNRVWHIDLTHFRVLWRYFTVVAILDGFSRRLLRLRVHCKSPNSRQVAILVRHAAAEFGKPRFILTDHGPQFRRGFRIAMTRLNIRAIQGKVRAPYLNGKVERVFKTARLWWRLQFPVLTQRRFQRQLDAFRDWYNDFRPHSALHAMTPTEAWKGQFLPKPVPIRASDARKTEISVRRLRCHGDPWLPVIEITCREAA